MLLLVHDPESISSKANVSKFLENLEEMIPCYYIDSDVFS